MTNYTQSQLTEMAEQNPDEFVLVILETCTELIPTLIGWKTELNPNPTILNPDKSVWGNLLDFNPITKTEAGRSQAFELAERFDCFPKELGRFWVIPNVQNLQESTEHKDPQTAICMAAILTAQGERE